jgi:hypothetical protein
MSVAELFTPEWAQAVAQAMSEGPSDEYKARVLDVYWMWIDMVRADFDGELALGGRRLPGASGPEAYLVLSFAKGECTGARLADRSDAEQATYLLVGDVADWADLVGGYDAGKAVMYRRFQLERGELLDFFRRVYFWVETLALVGRVPAELPTQPAAA